MFKKKEKTPKQPRKKVFDYLGIESKKIKWTIRILLAFFLMFIFAAIGNTLSNNPYAILWWILSGICCCSALGIIIFKSNIN